MLKLVLLALCAFAIGNVYTQTEPVEPCLTWIKPQPVCPRYERYTCCKTCVEATCRRPIIPVRCAGCVGGCICKTGYIRFDTGGMCVRRAACRRIFPIEANRLLK